MSLLKEVLLGVLTLLLIVLMVVMSLNFANTKRFLQDQLASSAQDTANSLGLSLSSVPDAEDLSTMQTMINSVFDGGYYKHIVLVDTEDQELYRQSFENLKVKGVPEWFIDWIPLETPQAKAEVMVGWIPLGKVLVENHPGHAYYQLWTSFQEFSLWFLGIGVFSFMGIYIFLKLVLNPLQLIEKQAKAIANKELFIQQKLPHTTELRSVVQTMNDMVVKVKEIFDKEAKVAEKFRQMAYQDMVTSFSNRAHFELLSSNYFGQEAQYTQGSALMLRILQLAEINKTLGHQKTDALVKALSQTFQKPFLANEGCVFARLNGAEFVALLPKLSSDQLQEKLQGLVQELSQYFAQFSASEISNMPGFELGFTPYDAQDKRYEVMIRLDNALSQALNRGMNSFALMPKNTEQGLGKEDWRKLIKAALDEHRFILYQQAVISGLSKNTEQYEVLIRLKDEQGKIQAAGSFMPAAEHVGLSRFIDERTYELAFAWVKHHPQSAVVALNLTSAILEDVEFIHWVYDQLEKDHHKTARLAFEVPESALIKDRAKVIGFAKRIKELGQQFGVDRFGSSFGDFSYLKDLIPSYVKVDAAYTRGVVSDQNTRSYLESLVGMTTSLGVDVIATAIETEEELNAMKTLGISYFQGYLLSAPQALEDKS